MEAPERIWINLTTDLPRLNGHIDKNSIKYVRADVFIEKACEYLDGLIELLNDHGHGLKKERIIGGLKQAMEE